METPATDNKRNMQVALGVGAVILVGTLVYTFSKNTVPEQKNEETKTEQTATTTQNSETVSTTADTGDTTVNKVIAKPKPKTAKPFASYEKALESYQYKFQFVNCTAIPAKLTFKQGVKVMLDNRDAVARTIGIGTTKYTIQAYDFVIATAPTAGTYVLTCNGRTVGEVKTQK